MKNFLVFVGLVFLGACILWGVHELKNIPSEEMIRICSEKYGTDFEIRGTECVYKPFVPSWDINPY